MAGHPLRPARDRRLGEPLPHQLANPIWAHLMARGPEGPPSLVLRRYAVLATVSSSYPPQHQAVSQTLLTRPPLVSKAASCFLLPFDLHVLGLPPAFNLSHDQTLQFKSLMLKELNFVMNYVFTLETWYSFFVLRRQESVSSSAHTDCLINC